jgi:hypothetical protein
MNEKENSTEEAEAEEKQTKVYQLGDDTIAIIRELVQFTLLTGTNIVDHLRVMHLEYHDELGKLIPTEEYIEAFNEMIVQLTAKVEEGNQEMDARVKAAIKEEEEDKDKESN